MDVTHRFSSADIEQFSKKGKTELQVSDQLNCFQRGFPYLPLHGYATTGSGVICFDLDSQNYYRDRWREYVKTEASIYKFVPASGAASRMFKDLFEYVDGERDLPRNMIVDNFIQNINHFAFSRSLNDQCVSLLRMSLEECLTAGKEREVIDLLLRKGMNYGNLPKGVLEFHNYEGQNSRTPLEEHLVEGALYGKDKNGIVKIHFTVSEEYIKEFEALMHEKKPQYEAMFGVDFEISFSFQKSSTDTIAADSENNPFRDSSGEIVFRPGGHGALIENLNDLSADVVFIKNIDNVVPDHFKHDTIIYKELIAGLLVETQARVFESLYRLDNIESTNVSTIDEIARFVEESLCIKLPKLFSEMTLKEQVDFLRVKLNRPIRVCGVVKNSGEPGGGPYWVENIDGSISLQILESSQIDLLDEQSVRLLKESTHFNPVDLVCGLKDYRGKKFDLKSHVDPQTGFISLKSKLGKSLKALELPGLWNGAMSDWITLLVEVPLSTFNPVKTVNDLLRKEHQ